jgi:hypothetical protein
LLKLEQRFSDELHAKIRDTIPARATVIAEQPVKDPQNPPMFDNGNLDEDIPATPLIRVETIHTATAAIADNLTDNH